MAKPSHEPDALAAQTLYPRLSASQLRSTRRLLHHKGRQLSGEFLAEGAQAVREALKVPGAVRLLIVDDPVRHQELLETAGDVPVAQASPEQIATLSDTVNSQGVFAVCVQHTVSLADLSSHAAQLVVICAQVRDPGNAGTVVRCADAFGADAVILSSGSVELHNPKTVRASVGSIFHLPVVSGVDFHDAVEWARAQGLQVFAADIGGEPLDEIGRQGVLARPTAWVMGNEAWGLPGDELAACDLVVSVPMWGRAESLNLSTAAAVCLYATASAQHGPKTDPSRRAK